MQTLLENKLDQILQSLNQMQKSSSVWLTPDLLSSYTGLSKNTIYQYVSAGKIPYHKIPGSSKLLFLRKEIDDWILQEKHGNQSEADLDVSALVDNMFRQLGR